MTEETIHEVVRSRYSAIAQSTTDSASSCCGDSSCCGSSDAGCGSNLYDMTMLEGLPLDVTNLSLGCGDPISIASLREGETVTVKGFAVAGMEGDIFVAAEIRAGDKTLSLRDARGLPIW